MASSDAIALAKKKLTDLYVELDAAGDAAGDAPISIHEAIEAQIVELARLQEDAKH